MTAATRTPRVVGWLALAGVSVIAGGASYFHALEVVQAAGATAPVAYLVPALADLVILGASADLLAASRAGQPRPRLTMVALGVGVVVTLAMNVAAGSGHGLGGRLVAGWPALAFILALESLAGLVRRGRGGPTGLAAVGSDGSFALALSGLPATGGSQVYEAWIIAPSGSPVPVGSFAVGASGLGALTAAQVPTGAGLTVGLTREPHSGVTTPTLPMVVNGVATGGG